MPYKIEKYLRLFNSFVVNGTFFYITLQGLEWQFKNAHHAPNCEIASKLSWIPWLIITMLLIVDAMIIFNVVGHMVLWRKFRRFRRNHEFMQENGRIQFLMNEVHIIEEYFNGRGLGQYFISRSDRSESSNVESEEEQTIYLTVEDINKIPRRPFVSTDRSRQSAEEACPVCFEDFKEGEEICTLPVCNHVFHSKCIYNWFGMSSLCPMCRSSIKENVRKISTPAGFNSENVEALDN